MAEHMTAEQQELLSVAREAQFRAVKNAMREHFVGGRKMMRPYDDTRHYYAKIYSWSLPPGGAKARLAALAPEVHAIDIHLTMTDDHPWAQAFVILTARKLEP